MLIVPYESHSERPESCKVCNAHVIRLKSVLGEPACHAVLLGESDRLTLVLHHSHMSVQMIKNVGSRER